MADNVRLAQVREIEVSARRRVNQRTKGYRERQPFRDAVANMTPERAIELSPDEGESLRKLKLELARAAKEVGRNIYYGETSENTIIAWLAESNTSQYGRVRRRSLGSALDAGVREVVEQTAAVNLGRVADEDPLAAARIRGEQAKRDILAMQGDLLDAAGVAARLGIDPAEVEQRRRDGLLLALPLEGGTLGYPAWQFADNGMLPGLEVALRDLGVQGAWTRAAFFLSGDIRLDWRTPLEMLLRGEVEAVRRAAAYGEQGAA